MTFSPFSPSSRQSLLVLIQNICPKTEQWNCVYHNFSRILIPLHNENLKIVNTEIKYDTSSLLNDKIFQLIKHINTTKFFDEILDEMKYSEFFKPNDNVKLLSLGEMLSFLSHGIYIFRMTSKFQIKNWYSLNKYTNSQNNLKLLDELPNKVCFYVNKSKETHGFILNYKQIYNITEGTKVPSQLLKLLKLRNDHNRFLLQYN